jgi:DNA-binding GntR family transcriptional regulator
VITLSRDQADIEHAPRFKIRTQLSDEVASFVRDSIMSGQLRGNEYVRLDWLANHLGVSTTPVREALLSLRAEGFVALEPRKGFVVLPINSSDVKDVFLAQASLSGELASRAAMKITDEAMSRLRSTQVRLREAAAANDFEAIEMENYLFHREINLLGDAPKLAWLLGMVARYSPRRFFASIHGWTSASIEDHDDILSALEQRDGTKAMEAMYAHLIHAGDLLAEYLINLDESDSRLPIFHTAVRQRSRSDLHADGGTSDRLA